MYYNENTIVFLDNQYLKATDARCNIYSQSLHYGHGVFEGIRSYNTEKGPRIFKAKEHYDRLIFSAKTLLIPFNYSVEELININYEVLKRNNLTDAYIRPLIFCNEPNMSLTPPKNSSLFFAVWEWGKYLGDKLIRVMVSPYQRPNPKAFHIEAKASGHYVNSTLAGSHARTQGYDEALLLDEHGNVAEGPGANFFFEKNGILFTPPKGNILPGITRNTIIDLARELGMTVEEKLFKPEEIKGADGAFFTGTAAEVSGIASVNNEPFKKEFGQTLGAVLQKEYSDLVREKRKAAATR